MYMHVEGEISISELWINRPRARTALQSRRPPPAHAVLFVELNKINSSRSLFLIDDFYHVAPLSEVVRGSHTLVEPYCYNKDICPEANKL